MRYDGATKPDESLLPQCLALIHSSEQARAQALAEKEAAAERERVLLAAQAQADAERARLAEERATLAQANAQQAERLREQQVQRARDAEAAAVDLRRSNRRTRVALTIVIACGASAVLAAIWAYSARRTALAAQDKAERAIASGYVHSLGHYEFDAPLNPTELNALWELAEQQSDRIRDLFVETSLLRANRIAAPAAAARSCDPGSDRLARRPCAAMRDVLMAKLQDPKADEEVRETSIDVGLAIREMDPLFFSLGREASGREG